MKRDWFRKRYSDVGSRWNIDPDVVKAILEKYDILLADEIKKLKTHGMQLPKHFRDIRTDEEYIYDIIDGWVVEDIITKAWLSERLSKIDVGVKVQLMGADSNRVIQKYNAQNITTEPDMMYSVNGIDRGVELQMARKVMHSGYDMKEGKVQRAISDDSYFLWIIIPHDTFFIIRPRTEMADIIPQINPLWGGKMVYHINNDFIESIGGYGKMNESFSDVYISKLKL